MGEHQYRIHHGSGCCSARETCPAHVVVSDHFPIKLIVCDEMPPPPKVDFGRDIFRIKLDAITNPDSKRHVNHILKVTRLRARLNPDKVPNPYTFYWEKAKESIFDYYKKQTKKLLSSDPALLD